MQIDQYTKSINQNANRSIHKIDQSECKSINTQNRSIRMQIDYIYTKSINQNANRLYIYIQNRSIRMQIDQSIHKIDQSECKSSNFSIFHFSIFHFSIFQYFIHQNGAQKRNFDFLEISAHKLNSSLKWHLLTPAPLSFKNNRIV